MKRRKMEAKFDEIVNNFATYQDDSLRIPFTCVFCKADLNVDCDVT